MTYCQNRHLPAFSLIAYISLPCKSCHQIVAQSNHLSVLAYRIETVFIEKKSSIVGMRNASLHGKLYESMFFFLPLIKDDLHAIKHRHVSKKIFFIQL